MHRQGFYVEELSKVSRLITNYQLPITGTYTHFASAKDINYPTYTEIQFKKFLEAIKILENSGGKNLIKHAAATGEHYLGAGVGRGEPVTIRAFAETAKRLSGSPTRLDFGALPYREGELMRACADVTLLRRLGWPGARPLEEGLRETIAWEREHRTR